MKKVLVVGSGAVGQVYASALERAGVEVTFHVRPKHREWTEAGLRVEWWRAFGRRSEHVFASPRVTSTVEEAAAGGWDAVWLCIPSNGVHEVGTQALLEAVGDALVVSLTPGLDDRARLLEVVPEERLVTGLIPFLAWSVDGEGERPRTALWFPPMASCAFEGKRAAGVVRAIRAGGFRARVQPSLSRQAPFGSAFLLPMVAELETAGWRLAGFDGEHRRRFRGVVREAARVVAKEVGTGPPPGFSLLPRVVHPWTFALANLFTPLDLEAFFRKHFLKVGAQTTRVLGVYIERAEAHDLGEVPHLRSLLETRRTLGNEAPDAGPAGDTGGDRT